ncbi:hypothetical protein [Bradyrhizobium sp. ARR65]|uniref:hypothetical protein n=1 Tax=Bradyrhizobium sp. ARR65 TaxID=1040989 RepID=UPI0018DDBE1E|nr:hypothetical protein [Bradyrhizobium sp. ARR65]
MTSISESQPAIQSAAIGLEGVVDMAQRDPVDKGQAGIGERRRICNRKCARHLQPGTCRS